ncbi:MAG TPA: tetratricopeptide repeat protein [Methylomirabilota bacterium]|nr:tetratricopeptide repeat protein [Methylomirabilota bacterium]
MRGSIVKRRWLAVALLVVSLTPAAAAAAVIPLDLRFDGQPIEPTAPPDFTCWSAAANAWVSCGVKRGEGPGAWLLEGLPPGRYRLHVSIDENPVNPRRFPGDYEAQLRFEVTERGPERLTVDMVRLLHLTRPGDNGRALEGMLTSCATQPVFETPRHSWGPTAQVRFAWDPVVAGAEYQVSVTAVSCSQPDREREVLRTMTGATEVTLSLPPSVGDEQYYFWIAAWRDGRLVGDLYTHDAGVHSWNYRFTVRNASLSRWVYVAGAGLILLLIVGVARLLPAAPPTRRRRLARRALALIVVFALAGGAYYVVRERVEEEERRRAEEERAQSEAEGQARQRELIAAFVSAAPRPAWWASVQTPYRVDTVGDLLAAWQGFPRGDDGRGERQFFKAVYRGIVNHPEDEHLVATAIDLLHWVVDDYPHRLSLAQFGYDRYFQHRQRVDSCANCMPGDRAQGLTQNLGRLLMAAGRYDEAIAALRRLIDERAADVSPYRLAETWNRLAWAYWEKGERERAREVIREAIAKYGGTARGDDLRRTLATFEKTP